MRLKDVRTALAFLHELYAVPHLEGFQTHVLSALPRLFPVDTISYNEVNQSAKRNEVRRWPALPSEYEPVFLRHMGDHPLIAHYHKTRDGRALRISDFLSSRQFHRVALYNEYFRPLRIEYQMALTLPAPLPLVVGMALGRSGRDFSQRETQLLNMLRPHLVQAYRNAESVTRMQEEHALMRRTLDELSYGIVVLSRDARLRLANAQAVRMLTTYCGGSSQRGARLPEVLERWVRHQVAATQSLGSPRLPLVMERGGRNLVVRLVGGADDRLLLLEEQTIALDPRALLSLGLTRREAEVMTRIVQGKTNAEIATVLGMSPYTVIKHLQHIFDKLGVRTRTAAASYVLKAVKTSTQ